MSEYMRAREEIERLQKEHEAHIAELRRGLEPLRAGEVDAEAADIRKRIAAFGIRPLQLFSAADIKAARAEAVRQPPKYRWDGKEWSGIGTQPTWYSEALAAGVTADRMLIRTETELAATPPRRGPGRPPKNGGAAP